MKLFKKKDDKKTCCGCSTEELNKAEVIQDDEGIKILGAGCAKCNQLEKSVKQAIQEMNLNLTVDHVTDFAEIATYGVMSTPALVLNGEVVSFGKVLSVEEVKHILSIKL